MISRIILVTGSVLISLIVILTGTSNALLPAYANVDITFDQETNNYEFTTEEMNATVTASGTVTCSSYVRGVNVILTATADNEWSVSVNPETMTFGGGTSEEDFTVVLTLPTNISIINVSTIITVVGTYTLSPGGALMWLPTPAQTTVNIQTINVTEPAPPPARAEETSALGRYLPVIIILLVITIIVVGVVLIKRKRNLELARFRLDNQ